MDLVGGFPLADGTSAKALTGIDDHSRFCVSACLMARERTWAVCDGLRVAIAAYWAPVQILTDNGKVFTGRFNHPPVAVLFDAIRRETGIEHLLTQPRSPTPRCGPGCAPTPPNTPAMGSGRAWAALRYDERREVNKKKVHRLWREEGLQVRVRSPRKRAGTSSVPPVKADAPKASWAIDFQFDSTIDGKAIKIASMIDEHTRESLLNLVERSITGEHLVEELKKVFTAHGGPPMVLRMDNGPEMVSQALQQFLREQERDVYIPPGCPWDNGYIESFNNPLRKECLDRNHWNTLFEVRVVIGDFKTDHNTRHRHSALGYRTPAECAAACNCSHTPVACSIN